MDTYEVKINVENNWHGGAGVYTGFNVSAFVEGRSPQTAENKALRAWFGSPENANEAGAIVTTIQVDPMNVPSVDTDGEALADVELAHDLIRAGAADWEGEMKDAYNEALDRAQDAPVDHEIPHFQGMSAKELKALASKAGVVNYSRMLKADLVSALLAA